MGSSSISASTSEAGSLKIVCDSVTQIMEVLHTDSELELRKNYTHMLRMLLCLLLNYSDCCDEVTYFMRDHGYLMPACIKKLREWKTMHFENALSVSILLIAYIIV